MTAVFAVITKFGDDWERIDISKLPSGGYCYVFYCALHSSIFVKKRENLGSIVLWWLLRIFPAPHYFFSTGSGQQKSPGAVVCILWKKHGSLLPHLLHTFTPNWSIPNHHHALCSNAGFDDEVYKEKAFAPSLLFHHPKVVHKCNRSTPPPSLWLG